MYRFTVLEGSWAVLRLEPTEPFPYWGGPPFPFLSVTVTDEELSIVCPEPVVPPDVRAETGWALLKVLGPIPFSEVGVLASFATALTGAGISLFAISTYDTDYLMVKQALLDRACDVLREAGHVQCD